MAKFELRIRADLAGLPLDKALAVSLGVPRQRMRQALNDGAVFCDGRKARLEERAVAGALVRGRFQELEQVSTLWRVLFQDEWLLAVSKPAGLPSHRGADASRANLADLVKAQCGPDWVLQHRLDADTSGLVLWARKGDANLSVSAQFAQHTVRKVYLAKIEGRPPRSEWTCREPLLETRSRVVVDRQRGKPSLTHFRVLAPGLVEARPETGRKHQIRVHLAAAGTPIVGDKIYGRGGGPRLCLHHLRIGLAHPGTSRPWTCECSPDREVFNGFSPG